MQDIQRPLAPGRKNSKRPSTQVFLKDELVKDNSTIEIETDKSVITNLVLQSSEQYSDQKVKIDNKNESEIIDKLKENKLKSEDKLNAKENTATSVKDAIFIQSFEPSSEMSLQQNDGEPLDGEIAVEAEELLRKKRLAEENRKKRATFLSSLDDFSNNFEEKSKDTERNLHVKDADFTILSSSIREASSKYQVSQKSAITKEDNIRKVEFHSSPEKTDELPQKTNEILDEKFAINSSKDFNKLSSSLFHKSDNYPETISDTIRDNNDTLSVPNKLGMQQVKSNGLQYSTFDDDFGSDEEGGGDISNPRFSHFLTREERLGLNAEQRAAWRALQGDLTTKRKDFHGAVTYAFEGIFSWQMYGSAEAVDEMGKEYTEYLMRCQWGTTWDNLQPWIAARRYREFDRLDSELKKKYPNLANAMPKLPEKDYFRFLEADVISRRRKTIQEYMCAIVSTMPTILKSPIMDEFLGISERLNTLKSQLKFDQNKFFPDGNPEKESKFIPPGVETELGKEKTDEATANDVPVQNSPDKEIEEFSILTADDAESMKIRNNCEPLDEDSLGLLEEDIQQLILLMSKAGIKDVGRSGQIRKLLISCTNRWPYLRATSEFGSGVDFALIPRSMQAEEDLVHCLNDYKSLVAAHFLV